MKDLIWFDLQSTKRDEERWTSMEEKAKQEDDHWQRLREEGIKAKKNESNVSYDILTMQYSQDAGGELQKYQDDQGEFVWERGCWFDKRWGTTEWVMSDD